MLMFSGCKTDFSDYTGINLMTGKGFGSGTWTADRSETYYMTPITNAPAEASALITTGLPGTAAEDIRRIEIPNLFPNGDFEDNTDGDGTRAGTQPPGWAPSDVAVTGTEFVLQSGVINNNSLYYDFVDNTYRADYNLRDTTYGLLDGFLTNVSYLIRFEFASTNAAAFGFHDGTNSLIYDPSTPWVFNTNVSGDLRAFPTEEQNPELTPLQDGDIYFSIGSLLSLRVQEGNIDNIRVVRSDIDQYAAVLLEKTTAALDSTGEPLELIDGTYQFSLYIKQDPTNTKAREAASDIKNRLPARAVTLRSRLIEFDDALTTKKPLTTSTTVHKYNDEGADWSGWYLVSHTFELQWNPVNWYGGPQHLELGITPTDMSLGSLKRDAGSILVAAPSLQLVQP